MDVPAHTRLYRMQVVPQAPAALYRSTDTVGRYFQMYLPVTKSTYRSIHTIHQSLFEIAWDPRYLVPRTM